MGKVAFIFPGQGSQRTGMGLDLYENYDVAKATFNKIDEAMGRKISSLCFEGSADDLKQTINTQPALLAVSIVAYEALKNEANITADFVAGHSLGEYGALYASGALDLENAFKAISYRAKYMDEIDTKGAMCAVLGLSEENILACLKQASEKGYVDVANYNEPNQTVITGEVEAVNYASELLKEKGARRVIPLAVSGAFHSKLMKGAADKFSQSEFVVQNATIPVITNVDAEITTNGEDIKPKMAQQIYSSVQWTKTIQKMMAQGVDTFVEIGEGKVLSGLVKKIYPEAKIFNVSDSASLKATIDGIKG